MIKRIAIWIFISLFLSLSLIYPAHAQQVPSHINAWTGSVFKTLQPALETFKDGQGEHRRMVQDFYQDMRGARLSTWKGGNFKSGDKVTAAINTFLGAELPSPEIAYLINHISQKGSVAALRNHYAKTKVEITEQDLLLRAVELENVLRSAWSDLAQSYEVKSPDGQDIQLEWDPLFQIFEMSADHKSGGKTTISNEIIAHVDKDDKLSFKAKPMGDAIQPLTKAELQHKKRVMEKQIIGNWTTVGGETWVIDAVNKKSGSSKSDPTKELRNKVAQLKKDIATLKAQKSYIWQDKNGKEITQDKFKRLGDDFEYLGEKPSQNQQDKITAMEAEYEALSGQSGAQTLLVEDHDPNGFGDLLDTASGPLTLTVTQNDGYSYTYDEAIFEGGVIRARRTLRDVQDITDLPGGVISQLINTWAPPEWIELRFTQNPRSGEIYFEGERWRMHVTYSGMSGQVKSIHTPYVSENLQMTIEGEREVPVELEFVNDDGDPYLEALPYGEPVRLKATFDETPEEATRDVRLSWDGARGGVDWIEVKRKLIKRKEYVSEPFLLKEGTVLPNSESVITQGGQLKL